MDPRDPQQSNKELLAEADLTAPQKDLLLKTSATFSRAEIRELEKLLHNEKASTLLFDKFAYHR